MSWFKHDDGKTNKQVLKDRTTNPAIAHLILAALLVIAGIIGGVWVWNQTEFYLGAMTFCGTILIAFTFAADPYIDSEDHGGEGGWYEFYLKLGGGAGFLLIAVTGITIMSALAQSKAEHTKTQGELQKSNTNVERWKLFSTTKAPAAADGKLPFPDEVYKKVSRPENDKMLLPRFSDGSVWALRLSDKIVELSAGERQGYRVEEDVENLVVTGSLPADAKIYFVSKEMAPSVSRPLPAVTPPQKK
jgi:hypothetical protein